MKIYVRLIFKINDLELIIPLEIQDLEYSQIIDSLGDFIGKKDKIFRLEDKINNKCCFFKSDEISSIYIEKIDNSFSPKFEFVPTKEGSEDPC